MLLRSVKNNWKQVIGAHITDGALDPKLTKQFIYDCIEFCKQAGLKVVSHLLIWEIKQITMERVKCTNSKKMVFDRIILHMKTIIYLLCQTYAI